MEEGEAGACEHVSLLQAADQFSGLMLHGIELTGDFHSFPANRRPCLHWDKTESEAGHCLGLCSPGDTMAPQVEVK